MDNIFKNQVAIITGAGNGLGKSYAFALAKQGVKVVVNDIGGNKDGSNLEVNPAQEVVNEIIAQGGEAIVSNADITKFEEVEGMVQQVLQQWGRIDILVNNAGILRDSTFSKLSLDDFWKVMDVHVKGSVHCIKAVWDIMKNQNYGRILLTSSSSGIYGNFGQANYAVAKSSMLGLMNVLDVEGQKYNIKINMLTPTALTRMTEELLPEEAKPLLHPEAIAPAVVYLCSPEAPSRVILGAGAGVFARSYVYETEGIYLKEEDRTVEEISRNFAAISDQTTKHYLNNASEQTIRFVTKALNH